MEKQTVKELQEIAKQRGLKGYYKLHKGQLIDAIHVHGSLQPTHLLDSPVPVLQPIAYEPLKTLNKVTSGLKSFANWLISYVPKPIKRVVSKKLEALKSKVSNLFGTTEKFEIAENKSAIKGFTKQHTIDGQQGVDAETFLNTVRPLVVNLLARTRGTKLNLVLTCVMERVAMTTGEVTTAIAPFVSRNEVNLEATDVGELYNNATDKIKESMANFQMRGNNWRFKAVQKLDVNTVVHKPLRGSSYIPLPDKLANKKVIINLKNTDDECFIMLQVVCC